MPSVRSPKAVAPFGGREARLGTNPISIAVPSDLEAPFYLDMATSAVAAAVERRDRVTYFASLLNGDTENFFGPVVSPHPPTRG